MLIASIVTLALYIVDNPNVIAWIEKYYGIFYVTCIVVWAIPLYDGIRGQYDSIRNSSTAIENQAKSNIAYEVMIKATYYNRQADEVSENENKNMQ